MHQTPMIKTSPSMYQPVNVTTISPVGSQPQSVAPMMTQTIPPATSLGLPRDTTKTTRPYVQEKNSFSVSFMCSVVYVLGTLAGSYLTYLSSGPFPAPWKDGDGVPFWPYVYLSIFLAFIIGGLSIYLMFYLNHLLGSEHSSGPIGLICTLTALTVFCHVFIEVGYAASYKKGVKRSPHPSFWMLFWTLWAFVYAGICILYVRPLEKAAEEEAEKARKASALGIAQSPQLSMV
ncbi:hypothetical protein LTR12_006446 [Friedmanniomyces endolithicus]|nr:hypothetical protein LTR74_013945 [Friedmanniomyces endolithicus]KAK1819131.1 hypothetical protein LTR12_006446 [Friedmanniomyces endolithicus]